MRRWAYMHAHKECVCIHVDNLQMRSSRVIHLADSADEGLASEAAALLLSERITERDCPVW